MPLAFPLSADVRWKLPLYLLLLPSVTVVLVPDLKELSEGLALLSEMAYFTPEAAMALSASVTLEKQTVGSVSLVQLEPMVCWLLSFRLSVPKAGAVISR